MSAVAAVTAAASRSNPATGTTSALRPSRRTAGPNIAVAAGSVTSARRVCTSVGSASPKNRRVTCQFAGGTQRTPGWSGRGSAASCSTTFSGGHTAMNSRAIPRALHADAHGVVPRRRSAGPQVPSTMTPKHNDSVTSISVVWLVAAAAFAVANWWSRWTQHRPTELWSKPLTLVALVGAAIAVDPVDPTVRALVRRGARALARRRRVPARRRPLVRARVGGVPGRTRRLRGGVRARRAVAMVVVRAGVGGSVRPRRRRRSAHRRRRGRAPPGAAPAGRVVSRRDLVDGRRGRRGRQLVGGRRRRAVRVVRHDPRLAAVRRRSDRGCRSRSWSRTTWPRRRS